MRKLLLFIPILLISTLSSCLDNSTTSNTNPHIEDLYFDVHSHIVGLDNVVFTVDTILCEIYNEDSVSFKCDFTKVLPIVDTYETLNSISINDKKWNYTDSINMNQPIKISTVAGNKKRKASYIVTINKHKIEPDSIVWKGSNINEYNISSINSFAYNGKIYVFFSNENSETKIYSSNGDATFTQIAAISDLSLNFNKSVIYNSKCIASSLDNSSLYFIDLTDIATGFKQIELPEGTEIIDLWGVLNNKLYCTLQSDAPIYMSFNGTEWTEEACNMLNDLTTVGSAKINNKNTLYIISGSLNGELTNNVLATQDGNYWINTINQTDTLQYEPVKNACVIDYYDYFYLLGGTTDEGKTPTSYYSRNDGYSWEPLKSYQRPENGFTAKEKMAACQQNDYIYIFNCNNTSRLEVWIGRINRADFIIK